MASAKIMIVDDNAELVDELAEILRSEGYDVAPYTDSCLASDEVQVNDPDLVIVDLKMDKKSGFDLAGEISRRPETSHIPVVAMTGHYWPGRHDSLMQVVGIRRCLTKPVDPAELMKVIGEVLEQGR